MSSNAVLPPNPLQHPGGGNPRNVVDALIRLIRDQFPAVVSGAVVSAVLVQQVVDFLEKNIAILGGVLTTAGLALLLPSLAVVLVNLVGFTTSGVVAGSLAALIQSSIYAGSTGGIFSMLQSFGATAVVAPPVALALGGTFLVVGAGAAGYWLYQRQRRLAAEAVAAADDDDDSDDDDESPPTPPKENQPLVKRSTQFNIFDSFRRSPKY